MNKRWSFEQMYERIAQKVENRFADDEEEERKKKRNLQPKVKKQKLQQNNKMDIII